VKACGGSVDVAWDPPAYTASGSSSGSLLYRVAVEMVHAGVGAAPLEASNQFVQTTQMRCTVPRLSPGSKYRSTVESRLTTPGHETEWHAAEPVEYELPSDTLDPDVIFRELAITPGTSDESCNSLELTLPSLPANPWQCDTSDYLSVEWRIASYDQRWEPVVERVDAGDLPDNLLVVEELDPYETFEFRVLLHHLKAGGKGGQDIYGPGTGALMVGMLRNELLSAPSASATSSASVEIVLPPISPCRPGVRQVIWYTTDTAEGGEEDWQVLPETGVVRDGRHVYVSTLRCAAGCRFRWSTDDVEGWESVSEASEPVKTPLLPALATSRQRLEIKLGARSAATRTAPEEWKRHFSEGLSGALGMGPSDVQVVEVRGGGEFVTFDVSQHDARYPPAAALAALLQQPACALNLAVGQPGRCSSSCGNNTSPARVNDGDQRQYAPHVWQACEQDRRPWWSVQMPRGMRRPFVRVLVGECCAQSFQRSIDVRIGWESGVISEEKCATLIVDDGSAVGAFCEGEGDWVTISAKKAFSLAEVQVCEGSDVNPLLRRPVVNAVDTSAGLLEIENAGSTEQLTPTLVALDEPGRNAPWRLAPVEDSRGGLSQTLMLLGVASLLLALLVFVPRKMCAKRTFARVSDSLDSPTMREDAAIFGEDEEDDDIDIGEKYSGSVSVTFEWTDGTKISSRVSLEGVTHVEHVFKAVRASATKVLGGGPVDHISLQYMNANGQFEEAWWDSILREGSELKHVARSKQWRVLILGEAIESALDLSAEPEGLVSVPL